MFEPFNLISFENFTLCLFFFFHTDYINRNHPLLIHWCSYESRRCVNFTIRQGKHNKDTLQCPLTQRVISRQTYPLAVLWNSWKSNPFTMWKMYLYFLQYATLALSYTAFLIFLILNAPSLSKNAVCQTDLLPSNPNLP